MSKYDGFFVALENLGLGAAGALNRYVRERKGKDNVIRLTVTKDEMIAINRLRTECERIDTFDEAKWWREFPAIVGVKTADQLTTVGELHKTLGRELQVHIEVDTFADKIEEDKRLKADWYTNTEA